MTPGPGFGCRSRQPSAWRDPVPPARVCVGSQSRQVLYSACRRARVHRAGHIGTEHVLYGILLRVRWDSAWAALPRTLKERDRSSGPAPADPDGDGSVPDVEVLGSLREAAWMTARRDRRKRRHTPTPGWHPEVGAALGAALASAAADGVRHAGPRYLLAGVLADPRSGARELLRSCGVDPSRLLAAARADHLPGRDAPLKTAVEKLEGLRVLETRSRASTLVYAPLRPLARLTRVDPMLVALEMEAVRQAVRAGATQLHTGHLLLAALELDRNLQAVGATLPEPLAAVNGAGGVLAEHGVDYRTVAACAETLAVPLEPTVRVGPGPWWWKPSRRRWWRVVAGDPPWAISAGTAADRALADAQNQRTRAGSSHLLVAALAVPDGPASRLLRQLGADSQTVAAETARRAGAGKP